MKKLILVREFILALRNRFRKECNTEHTSNDDSGNCYPDVGLK